MTLFNYLRVRFIEQKASANILINVNGKGGISIFGIWIFFSVEFSFSSHNSYLPEIYLLT